MKEIEDALNNMPPGNLQVHINNKYYRWFYENQGSVKYIPKKEIRLAQTLAEKQYLLLRKEYLATQLYSIEFILDTIKNAKSNLDNYLQSKRFSPLLSANTIIDESIESWRKQSYSTNPNYKNQLTFSCPSGNLVRSKSEVFIDMVLNQNSIPFRYECELNIYNKTFYPDFTILHPLTKELIYWEHFGKMDDPDYANKAYAKLKFYHSVGIIPGKNLIVTFETKDKPFTYKDAKAALSQLGI